MLSSFSCIREVFKKCKRKKKRQNKEYLQEDPSVVEQQKGAPLQTQNKNQTDTYRGTKLNGQTQNKNQKGTYRGTKLNGKYLIEVFTCLVVYSIELLRHDLQGFRHPRMLEDVNSPVLDVLKKLAVVAAGQKQSAAPAHFFLSLESFTKMEGRGITWHPSSSGRKCT